jgi:hypothetical protein
MGSIVQMTLLSKAVELRSLGDGLEELERKVASVDIERNGSIGYNLKED